MKNPNAPIVVVIILAILAVGFGLIWPAPAVLWFWVVIGLAFGVLFLALLTESLLGQLVARRRYR